MGLYPKKISDRLDAVKYVAQPADQNATGRDANFACGSSVSISLYIDPTSRTVVSGASRTNGCGYMAAAADVLLAAVTGRTLTELHGLDDRELRTVVRQNLGNVELSRSGCVEACIGALHTAFADFRSRQIEEFQGEKALICTCFGVTEETIERQIDSLRLESVEQVADVCNAGGGCGSCRMLIQEMLDHGRDVKTAFLDRE